MAFAVTKLQDQDRLAQEGFADNILGGSQILQPGMRTIDSRVGR